MDKDFKNFALSKGISSSNLNHYNKRISSSMTPYILEEREMRVTQMDIFSRLMMDRILWVSGAIEPTMASIIQAQLMFLESLEVKDITLHIDSPGGDVKSGLGIVDVMNYLKSDIITVNTGMAASMGSVLLSSGTKGKRSSLLYSKTLTHQVSHSTNGNIQDTRINQKEAEKYNFILFKILGENCGKDYKEVIEASRRDKWFDSQEALDFGLIDEIIGERSIDTMLEGFDEYYKKEIMES